MFLFLTVVQALIAAALVGVILVQRSEGGGLGTGGGNPSGLMSARGAADFLTRTTAILATLFVVLSIALAAMAVDVSTTRELDTSLQRNAPVVPQAPVDPLAGAANPGAAPQQPTAPAPAEDPLAGSAAQ
ncbi:preprotein translocase subunit SecG [Novosphingobium sp. M1R2S20]|uniref:Protein-export membrane protein SecG n=1 Tax=Novosphingobium rhizovicinum TaxID=3228928 RepID=A0ABV3R7A4_9SPHN